MQLVYSQDQLLMQLVYNLKIVLQPPRAHLCHSINHSVFQLYLLITQKNWAISQGNIKEGGLLWLYAKFGAQLRADERVGSPTIH